MEMLSDGSSTLPASTITRGYEHPITAIFWLGNVFAVKVKAERP